MTNRGASPRRTSRSGGGGPPRGASAAAPGDAVRALAADLCLRVESDGMFLDAAMRAERARAEALEPRDRGLLKALTLTTFRRLREIDRLLDARAPKPPPERVRWILRVGVAELMLREGSAHAAVDSAVRRTKRIDARRSGLVNAVLRRISEELAATREDAQAAIGEGRRAAPKWLWKALVADWGPHEAEAILAAHLREAPLDLTPDPRKTDAAALAARLGGDATPTGSVRLDGRGAVSEMDGFDEGAWWVQDAAAAIPARLAAEGLAPGDRALDLCAAPGGKTLQLATAGLAVTALDVSEQRLGALRENLSRVGATAEVVAADALTWEAKARFDVVLLDAPCSATGTIRRHPELPWLKRDWLRDGLAELTALQDRLLDAAWARVRPGGRLVFCTCSLLKAEGEARAEAFFARTTDARPEPISGEVVGAPEMADAEGRLRCLPSAWPKAGGLDGFFAVRARRVR